MRVVNEMNGATRLSFEVIGGRRTLGGAVEHRGATQSNHGAVSGVLGGAGRAAAVSRSRVCVVVRVLRGGARLVRVDGRTTHRGGAGVSQSSGGVRSGRERRFARIGAEFAEKAPDSGERGGAVRT